MKRSGFEGINLVPNTAKASGNFNAFYEAISGLWPAILAMSLMCSWYYRLLLGQPTILAL